MNAIEVRGLGKQYGSVKALTDVSFTARAGTVTALLGPNGAGKSTVINLMLGLLHGDGECLFQGKKFTDLSRPSAIVGALVDGNPLIRSWTPRQYLKSLGGALGLSVGRQHEVLSVVDLTDAFDRPVRAMSLGMRQRLGIALAILDDPDVLVLDEPSGGLDPMGVSWLFKFMRSFTERGGTVLVSSHLLGELADITDNILFLRAGLLTWTGTTDDFKLRSGPVPVRVKGPDLPAISRLALSLGGEVHQRQGGLSVEGVSAAALGHAAWVERLEIHELVAEAGDLRSAFEYSLGNKES